MSDNKPAEEHQEQQVPNTPEKSIANETLPTENTAAEEVKAQEIQAQTIPEEKVEDTPTEVAASSEQALEEETTATTEKEEQNDEDEVHSSDDIDYDEEGHEEEEIDYSDLNDAKLITAFRELLSKGNIPGMQDAVNTLRAEFTNRFDEDLKEKRDAFLEEGGNIIDFHYTTPIKSEYNAILFEYREKRNNYYKNLKRDLQANLKKREAIIEELKGLLNVEESIHTTYQNFKKLQDRWHTAGPIPRDVYNLTWNTYKHHVENFYDFLHLNREFRDLDFKHNLEQRLKIIARAEELAQLEYSNKTFRELQMLHKMWKEDVGPVAKEYRDDIWDKFSEATKTIHNNRVDFLKNEDKILETHYDKKLLIIDQILAIAENTKPNHNAWQQAIKKSQEQRDIFFSIGRVPRAKNKEIWSAYKEATRSFNRKKNTFYKEQKKEQYQNLEKKLELVRLAESHKDSDDFETVTPLMKKIQSDWKKVGHVPRKQSDKIWKQFKEACNHYFNRMFEDKDKASEEEIANSDKKEAILETLKKYSYSEDKDADMKAITGFMDSWHEIGRVPRNKMNLDKVFSKALDQAFKTLNVPKTEVELIKYNNKLQSLSAQKNDSKLRNEHFFISKKLEETKDVIRQLENNLGFFQNADESNPLFKDVLNKINAHKEQLSLWEDKLEKIKEIRDN